MFDLFRVFRKAPKPDVVFYDDDEFTYEFHPRRIGVARGWVAIRRYHGADNTPVESEVLTHYSWMPVLFAGKTDPMLFPSSESAVKYIQSPYAG